MNPTKSIIATVATALACACQQAPSGPDLPAGVALVETVAAKPGDKVAIPYAKYLLDNGLTVILHEDGSDPLVHVDVTYHVGSAREEVGKSGFAHFFEHMMFQGSTNVGDDEHFRMVSAAGGTSNGTTNADRTNYFQTVPANQLEKMLWLEADRMGFLLDAVTQEKFEVQRATVKNERAENYDNRPYGLVGERVGEALYPPGHPYSWATIGYVEDLDRVDVNDLKKFFLRWYGPNNATLTIGGDLDAAQTLAWVAKYFGSIPRGPDVEDAPKTPVTLDATRYISMEDNVALPMLSMNFPTVHRFHADEAPLDVLMWILGTGKTSLLYKNLLKNEVAVQANANHPCRELACIFTVTAQPNPRAGKSLADLERIVRDSFAEFETRGVTDDDLERTKMGIVSGMIYNLERVADKVTSLASYETFTGDPSYTAANIARYENVTKEDVMRAYRQYIKDQPAVVMSVVPEGKLDERTAEDTWQRPPRELPDYVALTPEDLRYRPASDDFDRSVVPAAGAEPVVALPAIWQSRLKNGMRVLVARNLDTPTTTIRLRVNAGQRDESVGKLGLAAMTAGMLDEATSQSTSEELSDRLQKLGARVSFRAGDTHTDANVRCLSEHLDATLAILKEKLTTPKFDAADFARRQAQTLQNIERGKKQANTVARVVSDLLLFGKDNPLAHFNAGTAASISALTAKDVQDFYQTRYTPANASMVVVSDLDKDAVMAQLAVFESWQGEAVAATPLKPFPKIDKTKIYLVDKPGAAQSEIQIGRRALPYDAVGPHYRAGLANFALGGTFSSRVNLNLREDKGYTYGARTGFAGAVDYGTFTASAGVLTEATAQAVREFDKEIRAYAKDGPTAEELAFTKSAIGQRRTRAYETPAQKVAYLSRILTYDLSIDFVDRQNEILENIKVEELRTVAARHMKMDEMVIVVVGDESAIRPDLAELGYEIVRVDADGNVLVDA